MALVADQQAKHVDLRHRDDDDRQQFEEVREWRRILEGMRAINAVPAAAVGEKLLAGLKRRDGPDRDRLRLDLLVHHHGLIHHHRFAVGPDHGLSLLVELGHRGRHRVTLVVGLGHLGGVGLEEIRRRVSLPSLRDALPRERDRPQHRQRNHNVERAAGEIDPEVADSLDRGARQGAPDRDQDRESQGATQELVHGEP